MLDEHVSPILNTVDYIRSVIFIDFSLDSWNALEANIDSITLPSARTYSNSSIRAYVHVSLTMDLQSKELFLNSHWPAGKTDGSLQKKKKMMNSLEHA